MFASANWVQFALDLSMVAEPGTTFSYCSPATHLLSAVLTRATGMSTLDFARRNLFEPLGIREALWPADPQGVTRGWGDLHLDPRDAAKLGQLWLNGGVWDGRPVVSALTLKNGSFEMVGVPPGSYYLYFEPIDGPFQQTHVSGYWQADGLPYVDARAEVLHRGDAAKPLVHRLNAEQGRHGDSRGLASARGVDGALRSFRRRRKASNQPIMPPGV